MSLLSRARLRLLRFHPKSRSATSAKDRAAQSTQPTPTLSPPTVPQSTVAALPTPPPSTSSGNDQAASDQDEDREDSEEESNHDDDEDNATPTTSTPQNVADTDVDPVQNHNPVTNSIFPASSVPVDLKPKAWAAPQLSALKPQLYLDLSRMTPFASPSGRPFGGDGGSQEPSSGVFTFTAEPQAPATGFTSTSIGLLFGRKYADESLTLKVGTEGASFRVHKGILTKSSSVFDKMLNGPFKDSYQSDVVLDEDDPDAFGIILDWLYTGSMPRFNPVWINKSIQVSMPWIKPSETMIHIPLPSYFGTATVSNETAPNGGASYGPAPYQALFQHISTQDPYTTMSPEELRFVEHFPENKEVVSDYVKFLQGIKKEEKTAPAASTATTETVTTSAPTKDPGKFLLSLVEKPSGSKEKLQKILEHLENVERIPVPVPFPTYIEAEYLQLTLVKVMITADKYCWEDLFNDAMDAYRSGEQHLGRQHPVLRHIELAYTFCPRSSPLVLFMADFAFYTGKMNQTQSQLVEVGSDCKEFMQDLMERNDGKAKLSAWDPRYQALKLTRSPLSKSGGLYHYHPTKDSLAGPCPDRCNNRQRERAPMVGA